MTNTAITLLALLLPISALLWAWKNRLRQAVTWRERLSVITLTILTADLAFAAVFLIWPYFGAKVGSGVARWELTARLVAFGFWVSAAALTSAIVCKSGKQRYTLLALSLVAVAFWFSMQLPVADFYAVEGARQAGPQMPQRR